MRTHVILAVLKRNLMSYFSGLLGYLFMVVFVVAASFSAFNAQFFTNNLANLDQLTTAFPFLLLFIIPAVTMTAWADEKRQGTDELLFTLPASDIEIMLGKYLSLVGIYTVALGVSLTMLGVLEWYASPDWGLLLTNYFGYWLAGSALIALSMFASALTSSVTVAFVLGAVLCAIPVFIGTLASSRPFVESPTFFDKLTDASMTICTKLSIADRLSEFAMGIVPVSGLAYFASLIAFSLYLNAVVISRRHWVTPEDGVPMGAHFGVRVACLLVALIAGNVVASAASDAIGLRFDLTSEDLYTLSDTTDELIAKIDSKNPVTIQAFLSPSVPRELVNQHTQLKGLLRQFDTIGGNRIEVRFVDVTPYSEAATEAELFGIRATPVPTEENGRFQQADVFMGAVISSPYDQVVIPYFESGSSIEYELTRSIRTVSQTERLTVGVLRTDAKVNGGFDMQSFRSSPEWRIVTELKKQYKIKEVSPDAEITDEVDVLLSVLPSSLTDAQMGHLVAYMKKGNPVLLLDDPLPITDPRNSPSQEKQSPGGGGMFGQQGPPPEPRASLAPLLSALDIGWENDELVWDGANPHPQFVEIPEDYVFITATRDNVETINSKSDVTSGLQELLVLYAGCVTKARDKIDLNFEPLLWTGPNSGTARWADHFPDGLFGSMNRGDQVARHTDKLQANVVAAHLTGKKDDSDINAIFVADVDFISDQLFTIAQNEMHGLRLDNVKFVLNCVDVLAGDTSYVNLRKRRPKHRVLEVIQERVDKFRAETREKRDEAETEAKKEIERVQAELEKEVEAIDQSNRSRGDKFGAKLIAAGRKQREFDVKKAKIDQEKAAQVEQLEAREKRQIKQLEDAIRFKAVLWPPIPAILLGLFVLINRALAEQHNVEESRRVS